MVHTPGFRRAERRSGWPDREFSGVLLGVAGDRGSERGAKLGLADECVVGRLGGGVAASGAAVGWVGSAVGAAG